MMMALYNGVRYILCCYMIAPHMWALIGSVTHILFIDEIASYIITSGISYVVIINGIYVMLMSAIAYAHELISLSLNVSVNYSIAARL